MGQSSALSVMKETWANRIPFFGDVENQKANIFVFNILFNNKEQRENQLQGEWEIMEA